MTNALIKTMRNKLGDFLTKEIIYQGCEFVKSRYRIRIKALHKYAKKQWWNYRRNQEFQNIAWKSWRNRRIIIEIKRSANYENQNIYWFQKS